MAGAQRAGAQGAAGPARVGTLRPPAVSHGRKVRNTQLSLLHVREHPASMPRMCREAAKEPEQIPEAELQARPRRGAGNLSGRGLRAHGLEPRGAPWGASLGPSDGTQPFAVQRDDGDEVQEPRLPFHAERAAQWIL